MKKTLIIFITILMLSIAAAQEKPDSTQLKKLTSELSQLQNQYDYLYKIMKQNEELVKNQKNQLFDLSETIGQYLSAVQQEKKKLAIKDKSEEK